MISSTTLRAYALLAKGDVALEMDACFPTKRQQHPSARPLSNKQKSSGEAQGSPAGAAPRRKGRSTSGDRARCERWASISSGDAWEGCDLREAHHVRSSPACAVSWIVGSASAFVIVRSSELGAVARSKLTKTAMPTQLVTAGGEVDADAIYEARVPEAGIRCNMLVLNTSPNALSLGRQAMEEGFSFPSDAGLLPMLSPEGDHIARIQVQRPHVEFRSRTSCR